MSATKPMQLPRGAATKGDLRRVPATSVVEMIARQARAAPGSVALEYRGTRLTFAELTRRAAAVAIALQENGIGQGDRVALWADRTPGMIAAALGAMQLRAAYIPIDPTYPAERVKAILTASDPAVLAYDAVTAVPPPPSELPAVEVSDLPSASDSWKPAEPEAEDAAYVVFTSGSSGTPKGVVIEHRSLANYVGWCAQLVGPGAGGAPLFASLGFDHAVTCLWVPLAQGRPVAIIPGLWEHEPLFGPDDRYDFLKITPSHVRFFERLLQPNYSTATRLLMFGGEALDSDLVRQLGARVTNVRLVNHYGPTEATVGCCWSEFSPAALHGSGSIPIGRPIWNSRAYVVDDNLDPIAPREEGQLVIAGACVARGYINGEQGGFIQEALVGGPAGARAYCTGDVVRLLQDGTLLFVGRNDTQVKVSGHRIEFDELRKIAIAAPQVAEVAFDVRHGSVDQVEAFVVPIDRNVPTGRLAADVRAAMACGLPPAVVPKVVHVVHELVFNAHGKFDIDATRALQEGDELP